MEYIFTSLLSQLWIMEQWQGIQNNMSPLCLVTSPRTTTLTHSYLLSLYVLSIPNEKHTTNSKQDAERERTICTHPCQWAKLDWQTIIKAAAARYSERQTQSSLIHTEPVSAEPGDNLAIELFHWEVLCSPIPLHRPLVQVSELGISQVGLFCQCTPPLLFNYSIFLHST